MEFPADICSRVTFVNFTVTRSSLQSQCLNQVLKAERPDIDEKRSDLLKLQGESALMERWDWAGVYWVYLTAKAPTRLSGLWLCFSNSSVQWCGSVLVTPVTGFASSRALSMSPVFINY